MEYSTLRVVKEGNVVTARLHRPEAANAINMEMVKDLSDLMARVEDTHDVAALVLRGGMDVFCSGIDLSDFSLDRPPDIHGIRKWEQMCRGLESLDKFTVAAVDGECTGGGLQLVLACDMRIAESHTKFRLNEVKLGFLPGMATFRLAKYIGLGRAKNLILTGRTFDAHEALSIGILDRVCEQAEFEETIQKTVEDLLPFHPVALELARRLLTECYAETYEDFIGDFLAAQHRAINSDVFMKLIADSKTPEKFE